jgi:hypothetical protein
MFDIVMHAHPLYFPKRKSFKKLFNRFPGVNVYVFHPEFENISNYHFESVIQSILEDYPNIIIFPSDGTEDICHLSTKCFIYDVAETPLGQLEYSYRYSFKFSYGNNTYISHKHIFGPVTFTEIRTYCDDENNHIILLPVVDISNASIPIGISYETKENIRLLIINVIEILLKRANNKTYDQVRRLIFGYHNLGDFSAWLEHFIQRNGIFFNGDLVELLRLFSEESLGQIMFTQQVCGYQYKITHVPQSVSNTVP